MTISTELVREATQSVCEAILGLSLQSTVSSPLRVLDLIASVRFVGDWRAELQVTTDSAMSRRIAGAMFACGDEMLSDAEVEDAVGEVTNMIGGILRRSVDVSAAQTLPRVWKACPALESLEEIGTSVQFDSNGACLRVCVCEGRTRSQHEDTHCG